jgi:hypothetical protein
VPALVTRRGFLKSTALITNAILAPRLVSSVAAAAPPVRLGLLVPESGAGASFLSGLRLALPDHRIAVERVRPGHAAVAQGAERLVAAGNSRLIGLLGPNLSAAVASQLKGSGATLLAVDTGANLIRADEESPQVVTHSLGLWRGAVALGAWSAQQYGQRGLVLSGIVESGYDMLHACELGLTEAGGIPLPAIVTHGSPDPVDWTAVLRRVKEVRPDVVCAFYSGAAAVEFLRAWQASGLRIPLVASPFLVDEPLLPLHQGRAAGIASVSSWAPGLPNPVNQGFVTAYQAATGHPPDAFALLGYEAGLLAAGDLQAVDGPRGWIRPGPLGATRSPLYLRQVVGETNQVVGVLPTLAENAPVVAALRRAVRTGWIAPYLA